MLFVRARFYYKSKNKFKSGAKVGQNIFLDMGL